MAQFPILRQIYEKFQRGDKLSDEELQKAIFAFREAADALAPLGPVFKLAWQEANRVLMTLEGYASARERSVVEAKVTVPTNVATSEFATTLYAFVTDDDVGLPRRQFLKLVVDRIQDDLNAA